MKKLILIITCLLPLIALSQETGIIPKPQRIDYHDGVFSWSNKESKNEKRIKTKIVQNIPVKENESQSYIIEITPDKITLKATTEQGLFYARQSLSQMVMYQKVTNDADDIELPCMTITDWPSLEYRGWMDDISRGPVPTKEFIKREIRTLAYYKMNFFQLYTEHLFKLDSHPDIAPTDGLTAEEINELSEYAKQYYVEFMGNQQCFAHAEKTLRIPFYDNIADTKYNFDPSKQETYAFLNDVFREVATAYKSKHFNINCDETEGLGSGKAKYFVDGKGKEEAYCEHITKVYDILKEYDKDIMMWGDIIGKDPSMIDKLPEDIQFVIWSYGAGDNYMEMLRPFKESGHTFWAATGASCWSLVFPDIETYMKNIANFSRDAYKSGAKGLMNTAWDDYGESMFNSTWHSMIWCAETTWNTSSGLDYKDTFNNKFCTQFLNTKYNIINDLTELSNIKMTFASLNEPLLEFFPNQVNSDAISENKKIQNKSLELYNRLKDINVETLSNREFLQCAITAAYRIYATATKNIYKAQLYKTLQNPCETNIREAKELETQYISILRKLKYKSIRQWDAECRAYSRHIVENRFDKIMQDIINADKTVYIGSKLTDGRPTITLSTIFNDKEIFYTTDGSEPNKNSNSYTKPFAIENTCTVKATCYDEFDRNLITEKHFLYHKGMGHLKRLNSPAGNYRPEYSGGGDDALINGLTGSDDYKDGKWQGFYGCNADIEIDFGKVETINSLTINFITNPFDWIMMPKTIKVYAFPTCMPSNMPDTFVKTFSFDDKVPLSGNHIFTKTLQLDGINTSYLRIVVENPGKLPEGTPGAGYDSWIFLDEIIIE
ncbi:MAG: FN3 associated domain-containing protein [Candidatus Limimorpha sp.]